MPRECLKNQSRATSKVFVNQQAKAVVAKVSTSSSTPAVSSEVAELKDMINQPPTFQAPPYQASAPAPPAPGVSKSDFDLQRQANDRGRARVLFQANTLLPKGDLKEQSLPRKRKELPSPALYGTFCLSSHAFGYCNALGHVPRCIVLQSFTIMIEKTMESSWIAYLGFRDILPHSCPFPFRQKCFKGGEEHQLSCAKLGKVTTLWSRKSKVLGHKISKSRDLSYRHRAKVDIIANASIPTTGEGYSEFPSRHVGSTDDYQEFFQNRPP
ncbi:hypothetical protein Tco_0183955 [Tanacetum coccineum]